VPTKKPPCDGVQRAVAGPTPEDIVDSIRAEYGMPRPKDRKTPSPEAAPASPTPKKNEVKP
jgi:hypothetical protein